LPGFPFLQQLALAHHATEAEKQAGGDPMRYVVLGDHLSAGERDDKYDDDQAPRVPALLNPFASSAGRLVRPSGLNDSHALLQVLQNPSGAANALAEVVEFLREALAAAGRFAGDDLRWLVDHLSGAIEASASLAPSAFWHSVADISLAAHLQMAGAFAGALAAGGVQTDLDLGKDSQEPIATLIAGDLSGIQAFIHRVASKGAARSLRARSFYLTTLSLVCARAIAERLGVTSANVLSSVGGNFLILAPRGCEDALNQIAADVDAALVDAHGASLSLTLTSLPLTPADADARRFGEKVQEVRQQLAEAKARRAETTATQLGVFEPQGSGGPLRACRSCGGDAADGVEDQDERERICSFCHSLEELGRQLPAALYFTLEPVSDGGGPEWQRVVLRLGYSLQFHKRPPPAPFAGAIYALSPGALHEAPCARLLPSGRYVPTDGVTGAVVDFREIAERSVGRHLLAVLKADVDDLGKTFREHFKRNEQSPSRIATFMRFLSLFFEGRVNDLAEKEFPNVYVVFAGGDDLAVVGPWDQVLDFVQRVREEFSQWTGGNPAFHFSAGISFGDATRPVMAALDEAERLLGKAKGRQGKNAVALLDERVLSWDDFDETLRWYQELQNLVVGARGSGGVARSLLQRLKRLDVLTEPENGKVVYGPELWRAYYSLRRFAERHKQSAGQLDAVYARALTPNGGLKLAMAARLAEFATTQGKEGN